MNLNTLKSKPIFIGIAVALVTMILLMMITDSYKNHNEQQKRQLQEERHRQATKGEFKKSPPFNIMDYAKPPSPANK